jgi:hypothetical protein
MVPVRSLGRVQELPAGAPRKSAGFISRSHHRRAGAASLVFIREPLGMIGVIPLVAGGSFCPIQSFGIVIPKGAA